MSHVVKQVQAKYPEIATKVLDDLLVKAVHEKMSKSEKPNPNIFKR